MTAALVVIRRGPARPGRQALALAAGAVIRHVRSRLRAAITSPAVLALLAVGGFTSIPLWWSMGRWSMAMGGELVPLMSFLAIPGMLAMYLWAPLVAAAVSGTGFATSGGSVTGRTMPALPIGPRARAVADSLVVLLLTLVARTIGLLTGLEAAWRERGGPLVGTVFGLALLLPLVLSWAAVPRLDWRGLLGPGLVMGVLPIVILGGVASSLRATILISLALSALVLAAAGIDVQVEDRRATVVRPSLSFRASPGPVARLRRDRWTGPLERQGVLVGTLLLLVVIVEARSRIMEIPWWAPQLWWALLGLLALTVVVFYPFGLSVASSSGPGLAAFWNGYFGRAWSVLPVPRRDVLLSVYAHGWIVGTALWVLFCGWVWSAVGFDGRVGLVTIAFELAGVPLAAGVLICAAVGDGRRGTLALCALIAFQLVVPVAFPMARHLGVDVFRAPEHRAVASLATAWLLAFIGGLPPLVHLRGGGRESDPSRGAPYSDRSRTV